MPANHGDHPVTFKFREEQTVDHSARPTILAVRPNEQIAHEPVIATELDAITARRQHIRDLPPENAWRRNRTNSSHTGLALSGGGIRSASFGLGALQGLDVAAGIEGIDYLSTVSGGGYVGCALTATMQRNNGKFPFIEPNSNADTPSVRHVRDYSNYLIPHGGTDIVTALGIIARGLVANAIIILPIILFFVWLTLLSHPDVGSLDQPMILKWNLADGLRHFHLPASYPLWGLRGFWFTIIILGLDVVFLAAWTFAKSLSTTQVFGQVVNSPELHGGFASVSKFLFIVTVLIAWFEAQPFILYYSQVSAPNTCFEVAVLGQCFSALLRKWIVLVTPLLAPIGAVVAFFAKYLGDVVALAKRSTGWRAWLKKILAIAAIWLAAIIIPSLLWLVYFVLAYAGIVHADRIAASGIARALADWSSFSGPTVAARLYFEAFLVTGVLALFLNPNATSLYRLYRDRLSKAFLFDPNPPNDDDHRDLIAFDPKLHQINTNLCPYPIVNAALNIEGSRYVNKRGRNADFFIFTPEYVGSDATGYVGTQRIEHEETALNLGTAMAISGAAISSNMGADTIRPLSLSLALLNIRLGYWLRNPRWILGARAWYRRLFDVRSFLLFKEMFSLITETSSTVYLTDGGHIENLGVYSLLKRRCKVIIAVDAEADPTMSFGAFLLLERYARIDLGVLIDLPWQAIRDRTLAIDKAFDQSGDGEIALPEHPGLHCAAGEIQYGHGETPGVLFYVKASLTGDESDYVLDYKRRNPDFPHETTGDQFFDEEQLEVYRALGFHVMRNVLAGETTFAVRAQRNETEDAARARILDTVRAALLGIPVNAAG